MYLFELHSFCMYVLLRQSSHLVLSKCIVFHKIYSKRKRGRLFRMMLSRINFTRENLSYADLESLSRQRKAFVIVVDLRLASQELQGSDDLSWDGWWGWQMGGLWVETVLVSDVCELVLLTVGSWVGERSLSYLSFNIWVTSILQVPTLLSCDSVAGLETGEKKINIL